MAVMYISLAAIQLNPDFSDHWCIGTGNEFYNLFNFANLINFEKYYFFSYYNAFYFSVNFYLAERPQF